jgi:hypothetical protein
VFAASLPFRTTPAGRPVVSAVAFLAVVLLSCLFSAALTGVVRTALYVYTTAGERPTGFENVDSAVPTA